VDVDDLLAEARALARHTKTPSRAQRVALYRKALEKREYFHALAEANGEEPSCPPWAESVIREFEAEFGTAFRN
jgi:hypothetical protein